MPAGWTAAAPDSFCLRRPGSQPCRKASPDFLHRAEAAFLEIQGLEGSIVMG